LFKLFLHDALEQEPFYFVTEFYKDDVLTSKGALEVTEALAIFIKICETISYIHENNIVHRDLKPDNIVLHNGQPIIIDFGLCFNLENKLDSEDDNIDDNFRLTETVEQIGSRYYIPPELETGRLENVSIKSDSYTLGKILYFLLTGKNFARENYEDLATLLDSYQLNYITERILSKTVTVDVEARLTSAELTEEAKKIKKLISEGFYPGKIDSICRFCGEGNYELVQRGLLKTYIYPPRNPADNVLNSYYIETRSPSDKTIPFETIVCNSCGHMQFFKIESSDL
jgi:serine/threonine protein kinase